MISPPALDRVDARQVRNIKFYTLGCKVNQYDTQSIRERFLERNFQEAPDGKKIDICLINTCTVTSSADRKSKNVIRRCISDFPRAKIIVTGCLVQKDSRSLAKIRGIDFILSKSFFMDGISGFFGHTRAFLKIQDGCNNFCSYCKVPLVRGVSRSRPLEQIYAEAEQLVRNGFKEIVLSGICLGAYGKELHPRLSLIPVIEALEKIEGLLRIRLSSIEASDISEELIDKMKRSRKLCRHLHIPLQSGDDRILRRMNRHYSVREYLGLIRKIKKSMPLIAITTDCLVGFPGEKEDNFQNTLSLIKKILPLKVHIFPYSRRGGTSIADKYRDTANPAILQQRLGRLREVARICGQDYKKKFLNKNVKVLIESRVKGYPDFWQGYTDNYLEVRLKDVRDENLKNKFVKVALRKIVKDYILSDFC